MIYVIIKILCFIVAIVLFLAAAATVVTVAWCAVLARMSRIFKRPEQMSEEWVETWSRNDTMQGINGGVK